MPAAPPAKKSAAPLSPPTPEPPKTPDDIYSEIPFIDDDGEEYVAVRTNTDANDINEKSPSKNIKGVFLVTTTIAFVPVYRDYSMNTDL